MTSETQEFFARLADILYPGLPDTQASLEAAILHLLLQTDEHPLLRAVVEAAREGSDSLLPYLTARADPVFDTSQALLRDWLSERCPLQEAQIIEDAADITVRMTISHLILPGRPPHHTARRSAAAVAVAKLLDRPRHPASG
ncbi:hypothetical protein [Streptomyces candidus]|uniref:hypothetical protein n=1 Tax=Streptomyces candidus TaxID=67283 RepID=UPI001672DF4C|nr:hypothetical protein [Streptomyces candidus]